MESSVRISSLEERGPSCPEHHRTSEVGRFLGELATEPVRGSVQGPESSSVLEPAFRSVLVMVLVMVLVKDAPTESAQEPGSAEAKEPASRGVPGDGPDRTHAEWPETE